MNLLDESVAERLMFEVRGTGLRISNLKSQIGNRKRNAQIANPDLPITNRQAKIDNPPDT
jgi:hypothetical protein